MDFFETQSGLNMLTHRAAMGGFRINSYLWYAAFDVWSSMAAGLTGLYTTVFTGKEFCHNQRLGAMYFPCTAMPMDHEDEVAYLTLNWDNDTIYNPTFPSFPDVRLGPYSTGINNAMQLMLAAVHLDIGNILPNNFLAYPGVLNATISANTELYQALLSDIEAFPSLGDTSRPAVIASEYLCHFPQRKPLGSLVIIMTVFASGRVAFLLPAALYGKKDNKQGDMRTLFVV
ncbi:hypothetical protein FRB93_004306 [Tulasnella sp. JGI-2019a]|nr:hypothetical protein FRB93_004306 [Tulasnella sp. JGI-2019a]